MTRVLALKGYLKPLNEIVDSAQVDMDMAEYLALAAGMGYIDNVPYYVPRKLETRVLFYRKSMVADAVAKLAKHRDRIDRDLKAQNGYGLPAGYALESDPNLWDFFDLYVAGSIWANEEYNGVKMARIAHRGARYEGTALDLIDKSLQLGATKEDLLRLNSDKTAEAYLWERVFIRNGLYNAGMWQDPWRGAQIYNGIKDGKVFLSFMQQIDNFIIHGWPEDASMPSYLPVPDDMGLALMPAAVSFELDKKGVPLFSGSRAISTGGWWWGVPKTSPNAELTYQFARYITSREVQARECSTFGMLPVRKDILNNLPQVFEEGWVGDIFKASVQQVTLNELTTVPLVKELADVGQNMVEAWYKLCVEYDEKKNGAMDLGTMKMRLTSDFVDKQKAILGADFPAP
jgi:ABC-type glycerol-3-phosphate transport system substrate-binding protein